MKRSKQAIQESKERKESKESKKRARKESSDPNRVPQVPKTLDNSRPTDDILTAAEIEERFQNDEFTSYFNGNPPKIIITTTRKAAPTTFLFADELAGVFFNAKSIHRGQSHTMPQIMQEAIRENYTDIIVVGERQQEPYSLTMIHLPDGPTAYFKLSSVKTAKSIRGHGNATEHPPELIMNHFGTMLGVTVGRFLMALFPQVPQFTGRQVVTFHNQRDFIFFRRHRYIFDNENRARMQELGPRFTLKLLALQKGVFNPTEGEFIWERKKGMNTRKSFFL